jgi:hypothetical protein
VRDLAASLFAYLSYAGEMVLGLGFFGGTGDGSQRLPHARQRRTTEVMPICECHRVKFINTNGN